MKVLKPFLIFMLLFALALNLCACQIHPNNTNENNDSNTNGSEDDPNKNNDDNTENSSENTAPADTVNIFYYSYLNSDVEGKSDDNNTVNAAVYEKNQIIEKSLNVKLNFIPSETVDWSGFADELYVQIAATAESDIILTQTNSLAQSMLYSKFYDFANTTEINRTAPWWNDTAMEALSWVSDERRFLIGDVILNSGASECQAIFYNKRLAQQLLGSDQFYEKVQNKSWTLDEFCNVSSRAYRDANDDTVSSKGDIYAFQLGFASTVCTVLATSVGIEQYQRYTGGSMQGLPYLTPLQQKPIDFSNKLNNLLHKSNSVDLSSVSTAGSDSEIINSFTSGQTLFLMDTLRTATTKELQGMEDEYGVIPYPLWSSEQERYATLTARTAVVACVPQHIDVTRIETVIAPLLEAMAREGHNRVNPAFYNQVLNGRYTPNGNAESQILEMIAASSTQNFLFVYNQNLKGIGNIFNLIISRPYTDYKTEFEKISTQAQTALGMIMFDEHLNIIK